MSNTFHKQERLSSVKVMDVLFKKGKHINSSPLKAVYLPASVTQNFPAQAMFVVPKKLFKKAKDRNKLKRRMREAYRLQKVSLYQKLNSSNKKLLLSFIYTSKEIAEYKIIETAINKLIMKFA